MKLRKRAQVFPAQCHPPLEHSRCLKWWGALDTEVLSEKFRQELEKRWKNGPYQLSLEKGLELRYQAQTDLYFLCNLLGRTKLVPTTHKEMTDFFVTKNPSFRSFEEFAKTDKQTHNRLLLVPRGGYKSTIDVVDCAQWTICFPDICLLILTGVRDLALDFVGEFGRYFTLSEDGSPKVMPDGRPSLFQILFPEHCRRAVETKQNEFTTPARRVDSKEPTIMAAGIEQTLSGWHFDVLKADDVVTNANSRTQHMLQEVNRQLSVNHAMLHPYGYFDVIGTWYDIADVYGQNIRAEQELKKEGKDPTTKILLRAALELKPESIARGITDDTAKEEDYTLWFPEGLTYEFLMEQKRKNQETYAIKYLNNPLAAHIVKFSRSLMISRTVDKPPENGGMMFQAWDLAYSEKESAKYTVGITGLFTRFGLYIVDMQRGRFGEYELPGVIATFAHKWKPRRVAIEDSMGAKWLSKEIRSEQQKLRVDIPIEFVTLGKGTKSKSKEMKARLAARLLGDGRLFFTKATTGLEEIYNELEAFPKGAFTDIVCSLSLLVNHFSNFTQGVPYVPEVSSEYMDRMRYNRIYGLGQFAPDVQDGTMIAMYGSQEVERDPLAEAGLFS